MIKPITFAIALAALTFAPHAAWAAAHVQLAETVSEVRTHGGKLVAVPFRGTVHRGERLRYTIVARNTGDRAAVNLTPVAKIPAGLVFIGGTAGAGAEYSADAGKTFSLAPRGAIPPDYHAIRWRDPKPLAPGARITFAYDVIVE